jgi:hypothetical protein
MTRSSQTKDSAAGTRRAAGTEKPGGLRSRSASAETPGKSHHPKQTRNRSLAAAYFAAYFATASKAKKATKARTRPSGANAPSLVRPRTVPQAPDQGQAHRAPTRRRGKQESGVGSRESGVGSRESGVGSRESGVRARTPTGFYISARGWTIGTTPGSEAKKSQRLRDRNVSPSSRPTDRQNTRRRQGLRRGKPSTASRATRHKAQTTKHGAKRQPKSFLSSPNSHNFPLPKPPLSPKRKLEHSL